MALQRERGQEFEGHLTFKGIFVLLTHHNLLCPNIRLSQVQIEDPRDCEDFSCDYMAVNSRILSLDLYLVNKSSEQFFKVVNFCPQLPQLIAASLILSN